MPNKVATVLTEFSGIALIADNPSDAAAFYSAILAGLATLSNMLEDWAVTCVIDPKGRGHITLADTIHDGNVNALTVPAQRSWMSVLKAIPRATQAPFPHRILPDPQTLAFKPFEVEFSRYALWAEAQAVVAELNVIDDEAYTAICKLRDEIDSHLAGVSAPTGQIRNFSPFTVHVTLYYLPTRHIARLALKHGLGDALDRCKPVAVPKMRLESCRWYAFKDMLNSSFYPFPKNDAEIVHGRQTLARIAAEHKLNLEDQASLLAVCLEDLDILAKAAPAIASDFREFLERLDYMQLLRLHAASVHANSWHLRKDHLLEQSVRRASEELAAFKILLDLLCNCSPNICDGLPEALASWIERFGYTLNRDELERLATLPDADGFETVWNYPEYTSTYDSSEVGSIEPESSLRRTKINCEPVRAAAQKLLKFLAKNAIPDGCSPATQKTDLTTGSQPE